MSLIFKDCLTLNGTSIWNPASGLFAAAAADDDDVQGAEGGKESEDEEFLDTSDVLSPEDRERALIRKKHTD